MTTSLGAKEIAKYSAILAIVIFILLLGGLFFSRFFFYLLIIPFWLWGFLFYFFRDPERKITADENTIVSPADGVITHIEKTDGSLINCESAIRVSIFLSVFDVHLNRAPFSGKVSNVIYQKGKFLDARDENSLSQNESNTVVFTSENKILPTFAIRQIAGLIARRIVCIIKKEDEVCVGSKIGMMKFSSRTDLILPDNPAIKVKVKIGDKVSAGITPLAKLSD